MDNVGQDSSGGIKDGGISRRIMVEGLKENSGNNSKGILQDGIREGGIIEKG
jgi:hypothetical protein